MMDLVRPTVCGCGAEITVTSKEVLAFDSIECPYCGADAYHSQAQYDEAYEYDELHQDYSTHNLKEVTK